MKYLGSHTIRGAMIASDTELKKVYLNDGHFNHAFRIRSFTISQQDRTSATSYFLNGLLATEEDVRADNWDWADNRQIAWCQVMEDGNQPALATPKEVIDPDNLIVEDLYIGIYAYGDVAEPVNYILTMDKFEITEWEGALSIVRNSSQG